jgi:hypothetical protein
MREGSSDAKDHTCQRDSHQRRELSPNEIYYCRIYENSLETHIWDRIKRKQQTEVEFVVLFVVHIPFQLWFQSGRNITAIIQPNHHNTSERQHHPAERQRTFLHFLSFFCFLSECS